MNLKFKILNPVPSRIGDVLDEFKNNMRSSNKSDLLKEMLDISINYKNSGTPDPASIKTHLALDFEGGRYAFLDAHVDYMGLSFYYFENNDKESSWFYYSEAKYCLGVYEAWDKVLERKHWIDYKKQQRSEESKITASGKDDILVEFLLKIIESEDHKPGKGWGSKRNFYEYADPLLWSYIKKSGIKTSIKEDNVYEKIERLFKSSNRLVAAYEINSAKEK